MPFNLNVETAPRLIGSDSLGSPTHTVAAQQHAYERYTPFGFSNPPACSQVGFAGQFLEASAEQYLLGNGYRGYMPGLMLFGTPDNDSPFGAGGINAYVYCAGDPANHVDPTGHMKGLLAKLLSGNSAETNAALGSHFVQRAAPIAERSMNHANSLATAINSKKVVQLTRQSTFSSAARQRQPVATSYLTRTKQGSIQKWLKQQPQDPDLTRGSGGLSSIPEVYEPLYDSRPKGLQLLQDFRRRERLKTRQKAKRTSWERWIM